MYLSEIQGFFPLCSVLHSTSVSLSLSDVKADSRETCCLDMAASQNLITHVKSPLPITSCATLVDHIMFLFLHSLGRGQSITQ